MISQTVCQYNTVLGNGYHVRYVLFYQKIYSLDMQKRFGMSGFGYMEEILYIQLPDVWYVVLTMISQVVVQAILYSRRALY